MSASTAHSSWKADRHALAPAPPVPLSASSTSNITATGVRPVSSVMGSPLHQHGSGRAAVAGSHLQRQAQQRVLARFSLPKIEPLHDHHVVLQQDVMDGVAG